MGTSRMRLAGLFMALALASCGIIDRTPATVALCPGTVAYTVAQRGQVLAELQEAEKAGLPMKETKAFLSDYGTERARLRACAPLSP